MGAPQYGHRSIGRPRPPRHPGRGFATVPSPFGTQKIFCSLMARWRAGQE